MYSSAVSKQELLELIDNWNHSLDSTLGNPIWVSMGWTKEQFREFVKNRKDVR